MTLRARQAHYERLNGKYLQEARTLLKKGEYAQASEKLWGAAVEIVEAVGAAQGKTLGTHHALWTFVNTLAHQHPDWQLQDAFAYANTLHVNFDEDHLPPATIRRGATVIEGFITTLRTLL
jgi:hypothetical protein